jgi:hypothetical protein
MQYKAEKKSSGQNIEGNMQRANLMAPINYSKYTA